MIMLIEDLRAKPDYDIPRLEKAKKGLARYGEDFYPTNAKLDLLIRLMRDEPTSQRIKELTDSLPWKAMNYIMTTVIRVLPDGNPNPAYKPKRSVAASTDKPRFKIPNIRP